nr:glycosyltransferase [Lysinibacillus timonensis]
MKLKVNDLVKNKYIKRQDRKNQFIFVGRLDKTKGIDKLLSAWQLLSIEGEEIPKLIVCGTGPEEQWCKQFVLEHNLSSVVKILGFVENNKSIQMIGESIALILPTQWYEGFPMTLVEAYGCGTPVLGSKIGNVGSLVIDGITGYTFNQISDNAIVEAVNKLLKVNESELDLYRSTYQYYIAHYTARENYKVLCSIYNKIN